MAITNIRTASDANLLTQRGALHPVRPVDHRHHRPSPRSPARHPRVAARRLQPGGATAALPSTRRIAPSGWVGDRTGGRWSRLVTGAAFAWRTGNRGAQNPHLVITRATKARTDPASTAYFTHLLDSCGVPPRTVRRTHLADLVNTMDPKLVAAAFGMDPQGGDVLRHRPRGRRPAAGALPPVLFGVAWHMFDRTCGLSAVPGWSAWWRIGVHRPRGATGRDRGSG